MWFLARNREYIKLKDLYTDLQGLGCLRDPDTSTSSKSPGNVEALRQPCFSCCRFRSARLFDWEQRQLSVLRKSRYCVDCGARDRLYLHGLPIFMDSVTVASWIRGRYMVVCTGCEKLAEGEGCYRCGLCWECVQAAVLTLRSSKAKLPPRWESCGHLRGLNLYKHTNDMANRREAFIQNERANKGMNVEEWVAYWLLYMN